MKEISFAIKDPHMGKQEEWLRNMCVDAQGRNVENIFDLKAGEVVRVSYMEYKDEGPMFSRFDEMAFIRVISFIKPKKQGLFTPAISPNAIVETENGEMVELVIYESKNRYSGGGYEYFRRFNPKLFRKKVVNDGSKDKIIVTHFDDENELATAMQDFNDKWEEYEKDLKACRERDEREKREEIMNRELNARREEEKNKAMTDMFRNFQKK